MMVLRKLRRFFSVRTKGTYFVDEDNLEVNTTRVTKKSKKATKKSNSGLVMNPDWNECIERTFSVDSLGGNYVVTESVYSSAAGHRSGDVKKASSDGNVPRKRRSTLSILTKRENSPKKNRIARSEYALSYGYQGNSNNEDVNPRRYRSCHNLRNHVEQSKRPKSDVIATASIGKGMAEGGKRTKTPDPEDPNHRIESPVDYPPEVTADVTLVLGTSIHGEESFDVAPTFSEVELMITLYD